MGSYQKKLGWLALGTACAVATSLVIPHAVQLASAIDANLQVSAEGRAIPVHEQARSAAAPRAAMATPASPAAIVNPVVPQELVGFFDLRDDQRMKLVAQLPHSAQESPAIQDFYWAVICDRRLDATTRNIIANSLDEHTTRVDQLCDVYAAMVRDVREEHRWRDYSLQHLANLASTFQSSHVINTTLEEFARTGKTGLRGTALLQIHRLETSGRSPSIPGFAVLLEETSADESVEISARMTAICLMGERRDRVALPHIRSLVHHPSPSIRRVSIAALGMLGDLDDKVLLQSALVDQDLGVSLAAKGAVARLDKSTQDAPQLTTGQKNATEGF